MNCYMRFSLTVSQRIIPVSVHSGWRWPSMKIGRTTLRNRQPSQEKQESLYLAAMMITSTTGCSYVRMSNITFIVLGE